MSRRSQNVIFFTNWLVVLYLAGHSVVLAGSPRGEGEIKGDAVCSFVTARIRSSVPQVPTMCAVVDNDNRYPASVTVLSVFSPTEALEHELRRAWLTALFQTAQALFVEGLQGGFCEFSSQNGAANNRGCVLRISDALLAQSGLRYDLRVPIEIAEAFRGEHPDPASEGWYDMWGTFLVRGRNPSNPQYMSKQDATWRGERACETYVKVVHDNPFSIGLDNTFPTPSCDVMFANDRSVYVVVDSESPMIGLGNYHTPFVEIFGEAFHTRAYNGAVVIRSKWREDNTRTYQIYDLTDIEWLWDEANSGSITKTSAGLKLSCDLGQTRQKLWGESPRRVQMVVIRVLTTSDGTLTLDLTDGSEWRVFYKPTNACGLEPGSEVLVFPTVDKRDRSKTVPLFLGPCGLTLQADFVKAWP